MHAQHWMVVANLSRIIWLILTKSKPNITQVILYEILMLSWTPSVSKTCCESHTCEKLCCTFFYNFGLKEIDPLILEAMWRLNVWRILHTTLVIMSSIGYCMPREATHISYIGVLEMRKQMDIGNFLILRKFNARPKVGSWWVFKIKNIYETQLQNLKVHHCTWCKVIS